MSLVNDLLLRLTEAMALRTMTSDHLDRLNQNLRAVEDVESAAARPMDCVRWCCGVRLTEWRALMALGAGARLCGSCGAGGAAAGASGDEGLGGADCAACGGEQDRGAGSVNASPVVASGGMSEWRRGGVVACGGRFLCCSSCVGRRCGLRQL